MLHRCGFAIVFIGTLTLAGCGGSAFSPSSPGATSLGARSHSQMPGVSPAGYKELYAFKGTPDGASPYSGLIAVNNVLYGTTLNGSKNYCTSNCYNYCYLGCGTVFSVDGAGNEQVVYNFSGKFNSGQDGSWPFAGLTSLKGTLYGTTSSAGQFGYGTVYTFAPSGQERVIYSFMGGGSNDGSAPEAPVVAWKNRLVGTTVVGGGSGCGGSGCGTVYAVSAAGKEKVTYRFQGGNDGYRVYAPVTVYKDQFYGATLQGGGSGCGGNGCGTIFVVSPKGTEKVLYRFGGTSDGAFPNGLTAHDGVLYGTTEGGGTKNSGTFFAITPSGQLTTLYNFLDIPDGNLPGASLIYYKGAFYGTTVGGGTSGIGTVFKIGKTGKEKVLYSFQGGNDGSDPQGPVYQFKSKLYGTTTQGGGTGCGGNGCGTVFSVKP